MTTDYLCPRCSWSYPGFHICATDYRDPVAARDARNEHKLRLTPAAKDEPVEKAPKLAKPEKESSGDRNQRIVSLYESTDMTCSMIAAHVGVSKRTVTRALNLGSAMNMLIIRPSRMV